MRMRRCFFLKNNKICYTIVWQVRVVRSVNSHEKVEFSKNVIAYSKLPSRILFQFFGKEKILSENYQSVNTKHIDSSFMSFV